jgi:hypothetical protein
MPISSQPSASEINVELGRASNAPFSIDGAEERALAQVPSGQINFSDFIGKSAGPVLSTISTMGFENVWADDVTSSVWFPRNSAQRTGDAHTGVWGLTLTAAIDWVTNNMPLYFTGPFEVGIWVKQPLGTNHTIIDTRSGITGTASDMYLGIQSGVLYWAQFNTIRIQGTTNILDSLWHHVVIARNEAGIVTMTLDGNPEGAPWDSSNVIIFPSNPGGLTIGNANLGTFSAAGAYDDITVKQANDSQGAVFDGVMTAGQGTSSGVLMTGFEDFSPAFIGDLQNRPYKGLTWSRCAKLASPNRFDLGFLGSLPNTNDSWTDCLIEGITVPSFTPVALARSNMSYIQSVGNSYWNQTIPDPGFIANQRYRVRLWDASSPKPF